ncbi:MAG: ribonuclease Z [Firmicutes bacterium]|nr:ribonuclease Z [Bacillota bacterium]
MLDICLLGTGGMMPLPYRHLTSCLVRAAGTSVLIDCGEGTQISLRLLGWSFKGIDAILLTHMHGDHVSGLPGLLLTIGNSDRTEPVDIYGPRGTVKVVKGLLMAAPELPFEVRIHEIGVESFAVGPLTIRTCALDHRIPCLGYRIDLERRPEFLPDKARDNKVPLAAWNPLQKGMTVEIDGVVYTPDMVLGEARRGLSLCYCTDTRPTDSMVELAREADLLICEGMYGEAEKRSRAHQYKHMSFREAALIAAHAGVKELWLTHFSPSLMHPRDFLEEAQEVFPNTLAGKDRMIKELRYEEANTDSGD